MNDAKREAANLDFIADAWSKYGGEKMIGFLGDWGWMVLTPLGFFWLYWMRREPSLADRAGELELDYSNMMLSANGVKDRVTTLEEQLERESVRIQGHDGALGQLGFDSSRLAREVERLKTRIAVLEEPNP